MEPTTELLDALVIVGPGRVGSAIADAARSAGVPVDLVGRDRIDSRGFAGEAVLLCVPDAAIESVAGDVGRGGAPGSIGHVSGATTLDALRPAGAGFRFSLHPLQTFTGSESGLSGCPAAIAGSDDRALAAAEALATGLGLDPFPVAERDRATYHAAASIASNFLVTLEQSAADLLDGIGIEEPRRMLTPLINRTLANWTDAGTGALTGPIARGDEVTVARHRDALNETSPGLLDLYDAMADRTRGIASRRDPVSCSRRKPVSAGGGPANPGEDRT